MNFSCWNCQGIISADEKSAGSQIECPHCQAAMILPELPKAALLPGSPQTSQKRKPSSLRGWPRLLAATGVLLCVAMAAGWYFLQAPSALNGRWMPLSAGGAASISRWQYDENGGRVRVTTQPPQPWFDGLTSSQISTIEFVKDGTLLLVTDEGTVSANYRLIGKDRLEFGMGKSGVAGGSVIPVEIGPNQILVRDSGSGRVVGSYSRLD